MVVPVKTLVFVEQGVEAVFHFTVLFAPGFVGLRWLRLLRLGSGESLAAEGRLGGAGVFRVGHFGGSDGDLWCGWMVDSAK